MSHIMAHLSNRKAKHLAWQGKPPPHPLAQEAAQWGKSFTSVKTGHSGSNPSFIRNFKMLLQNGSFSTFKQLVNFNPMLVQKEAC